jgi:hypothetical protein
MGSADVENIQSKDPPLPLALLMGHNPETAVLCYQAHAPSLSQKKGKNITLYIKNTKDSELRATQCFRFLRCTHEVGVAYEHNELGIAAGLTSSTTCHNVSQIDV